MNHNYNPRNNQRSGYNQPYNKEKEEKKRDFFFSNTYDDPEDASKMAFKVRKDLEPFREYLNKSIKNLKQLGKVSAECRKVKQRRVLSTQSKLVRVKAIQSLRIPLPEGNYYTFRWDNERYGDFDSFDALQLDRKTVVLEKGEHIELCNDFVVFKYDGDIGNGQEMALWLEGEANSRPCTVNRLDFGDLSSYSVESGDVGFIDARVDSDSIIYRYNGTPDGTVTLFGDLTLPATVQSSTRVGVKFLIDGNKDAWVYDEESGIVVTGGSSRNIFSADAKVDFGYEVMSDEDISELLNAASNGCVCHKNGEIELADGLFHEERFLRLSHGELSACDGTPTRDSIIFRVETIGQRKFNHKNKDRITLELLEDESTSGDVYSNVSYFFTELVEQVRDENGTTYNIKDSDEKLCRIEIEATKNGRILRIPQRLYIVPNDRQLRLQRKAIEVLMNTPCRLHAPLLELMQDKRYTRWGSVPYEAVNIERWYKLTSESYEGCASQREFVKKALATPDFAILEGPPGSGKTTTILEIIAQMIMRGKRVMLAASTNAAVDNILERLGDLPEDVRRRILAVRLGNERAISESVNQYTVFDLEENVASEVVSRANLVCGTIIGILKHPRFELSESKPAVPIYDCLIVDEASKTTFQEFLVPAVYSKRWILSGDLKQLTPYIDKDNIAASLRQVEGFDDDMQQAQTILMHLENDVYKRKSNIGKKIRFIIRAREEVIKSVQRIAGEYDKRRIAVLSNTVTGESAVTVREFKSGDVRAALVYGCDVLFCDKDAYKEVCDILPPDFIPLLTADTDAVTYKSNAYWKRRALPSVANKDRLRTLDDVKSELGSLIKDKTWASEIAWRLVRIQELFMLSDLSEDESIVRRYEREIEERIPSFRDEKTDSDPSEEIKKQIALLKEIALPSIIQLLQKGIESKSIVSNKKETTLNSGFAQDKLSERHKLVEYQHRMHDDISRFSAEHIYNGVALKNGTVIDRSWSYDEYPSRACWLNVEGHGYCQSFNRDEVDEIASQLKKFLEHAKRHPKKNGEPWTVACLTYYRKQENELKRAVKDIAGSNNFSSFYDLSKEYNVQITVYSVDKFQGKEADVVFLSMVKSGAAGLGFMDSPNRLNVAITRAKYQMVIVGDRKYFETQKKSKLLEKLAMEYRI